MSKITYFMLASSLLRLRDKDIFFKTYDAIKEKNPNLAEKLEDILDNFSSFSQTISRKFYLPAQIKMEMLNYKGL